MGDRGRKMPLLQRILPYPKLIEGTHSPLFFMGDTGDYFRDLKDHRKMLRDKYGVVCPICKVNLPKANPSILLPQQKCKVCGYVDPRARISET